MAADVPLDVPPSAVTAAGLGDAWSQAAEADARDPLAGRRERFRLADGLIYLDGNSLGALQHAVVDRLRLVVEDEWGTGLIRSWNDADWVGMPQRVAARIAPLVGADPHEIAVTDSTSTNLFKALGAAWMLQRDHLDGGERRIVLTDDANFPTDRYVAEGLAGLTGQLQVEVVAPDALVEHLDERVAVLLVTEIDYRSGRRHDAAALTARAHEVGALTVWDLSHSVGVLDVDLGAWEADLAVGCSYKYLSGGPGAPAFLYAAQRLHASLANPLAGWFGHAAPFAFDPTYTPAADATRFTNGTPPVLSLAALETALEAFSGHDIGQVHTKAMALTERFITLADAALDGVEVLTPREAHRRGAQVSLRHPQAYAVTQALIEHEVIGDHRPPDVVRFGFAPLYVRHVDVVHAVARFAEVLRTAAWDHPRFHARRTVT
ncbi:MAG: kynureninase [Nitriliruptoraceae bacterium]|nr:kynureninase [Nitriliruptoraceae bacterium]